MKLIPLNDWAVIRPAAAFEKTKGGIIIPDSAQENRRRARSRRSARTRTKK